MIGRRLPRIKINPTPPIIKSFSTGKSTCCAQWFWIRSSDNARLESHGLQWIWLHQFWPNKESSILMDLKKSFYQPGEIVWILSWMGNWKSFLQILKHENLSHLAFPYSFLKISYLLSHRFLTTAPPRCPRTSTQNIRHLTKASFRSEDVSVLGNRQIHLMWRTTKTKDIFTQVGTVNLYIVFSIPISWYIGSHFCGKISATSLCNPWKIPNETFEELPQLGALTHASQPLKCPGESEKNTETTHQRHVWQTIFTT